MHFNLVVLLFAGLFSSEVIRAQDTDTLFYEDFGNGFQGNSPFGAWTTSDNGGNTIWMMADVESPSGDYSQPWLPLASPTSINGWVIFDADRYNTQLEGEPISVGGYLYAPVLDFSNQEFVRIEFYQSYAYCCTQRSPLTLEVSSDNGVQWTSWKLGEDTPLGSYEPSANPEKVVRDISCAAAGHSEVLIRWGFNGDLSDSYTGFFYGLDDVTIYNSMTEYDLEILHQSFADINNEYEYAMWSEEPNELTLGLLYRNNGKMSVDSAIWFCEFLDEDMNVVETVSSNLFNVPSNSELGTCPADSIYYQTMIASWPWTQQGTYYVRSSLVYPETDISPLDNEIVRPISEHYPHWGHSTWSECDTVITSFETIEDASVFPPYGVGTTFYSNNEAETCGVWIRFEEFDQIEFAVIAIDLVEGFNYDNQVAVEWLYGDSNMLGTDSILYFPLEQTIELGVNPTFLGVLSDTETEGNMFVSAVSNSNWDNSSWQYRKMPNGEYQWDQGAGWTPAIGVDRSPCMSVDENEEKELIRNVNLGPVPADDVVHIQFELYKSDVAAYVIRDIGGKRINYLNLGRLDSGLNSLDIDVSEIASGTYILSIVLANGSHIERPMVVGR